MRRREFIKAIGSAVAWSFAAQAQQPALPVVAFVRDGSPEANARYVAAFRKGLNEFGYVEGQNVTVEYHWLEAIPIAFAVGEDPVKLGLVASLAGLVATQQAPTFSSRKRWPSGCGSCMNWCPRLFVLPSWSIRVIQQSRTPHCEARRKRPRPSAYNSRS